MHSVKIKAAEFVIMQGILVAHTVCTRNGTGRIQCAAERRAVDKKFRGKAAFVEAEPESDRGVTAVTQDGTPQHLKTARRHIPVRRVGPPQPRLLADQQPKPIRHFQHARMVRIMYKPHEITAQRTNGEQIVFRLLCTRHVPALAYHFVLADPQQKNRPSVEEKGLPPADEFPESDLHLPPIRFAVFAQKSHRQGI